MDVSQTHISPDVIDALTLLTDDGFCTCRMITDEQGNAVDYRFLSANLNFELLTGLKSPVGRTAKEMVPDLEQRWLDAYARPALLREAVRFQEGSDAMGRYFDVFATPVGPMGEFAIAFRDVSAMRMAEVQKEIALAESRRLLEELNHRVMNSLATISSLISMEMRARAVGQGRNVLQRIGQRIQALAELYKGLNRSDSVDTIQADTYIGNVLTTLSNSIGNAGSIKVEAQIEPVILSTRLAVPVGLMVNELVTNAFKYATVPGREVTVTVTLRREDGDLVIYDSGDGVDIGGLIDNTPYYVAEVDTNQLQLYTTSDLSGDAIEF
ncbi:hypothetical protein LCGC14_2541020, partial [marine sediment metagenome]